MRAGLAVLLPLAVALVSVAAQVPDSLDINSAASSSSPTCVAAGESFALFQSTASSDVFSVQDTGSIAVADTNGSIGLASVACAQSVAFNGGVVFATSAGLYFTDHTVSAATQLVAGPGHCPVGVLDGVVYLSVLASGQGSELWAWDGVTTAALFHDYYPGSSNGVPANTNSHECGGYLYHVATTSAGGTTLARTDGTVTGQVAGAVGTVSFAAPILTAACVNATGTLVFAATSAATGLEVWSVTPAGTVTLLQDVQTGTSDGVAPVAWLAFDSNSVVFPARTAPGRLELWTSDGTPGGTVAATDIYPFGPALGSVEAVRLPGPRIVFAAQDAGTGTEPWVYNGTHALQLRDIMPGTNSGMLQGFPRIAAVADTAYFACQSGIGVELCSTDGTPEGTRLAGNFALDTGSIQSSDPVLLCATDSAVYFAADVQAIGRELVRLACAASETENGYDDDCDGVRDNGFADIDSDGVGDGADCAPSDANVYHLAWETCNEADDNCNSLIDEDFDNDNDGVSSCSTPDVDCDNDDPDRYPGNPEIADGVDNDCDGLIDEGFDADNDTISSFYDCNDNDPDVNPLASEVCNGIDDNCDGNVDEGFDSDGDGFTTCSLPRTDCNDADASVYPGATEACNGVDDDCDGDIDDGFDVDLDGFVSCDPSCSDPASCPDLDCDDTNPSVFPGATDVCGDGIDADCDGSDSCVDFAAVGIGIGAGAAAVMGIAAFVSWKTASSRQPSKDRVSASSLADGMNEKADFADSIVAVIDDSSPPAEPPAAASAAAESAVEIPEPIPDASAALLQPEETPTS